MYGLKNACMFAEKSSENFCCFFLLTSSKSNQASAENGERGAMWARKKVQCVTRLYTDRILYNTERCLLQKP
jgi:hypothetical protein